LPAGDRFSPPDPHQQTRQSGGVHDEGGAGCLLVKDAFETICAGLNVHESPKKG